MRCSPGWCRPLQVGGGAAARRPVWTWFGGSGSSVGSVGGSDGGGPAGSVLGGPAAPRLQGGSRERRSVGMSDFWHKMGCCVPAKAPPKKKRRRIDRTMIGEPTNFVHLTHIGSGEMADGLQPVGSVQEQMRSKGPNSLL